MSPSNPSGVLIAGGGLAGSLLASTLLQRGVPTAVLATDAAPTGNHDLAWLPVPQVRARRLAPDVVRADALPLDLLLPGDHRLETAGRIAVVDSSRLAATVRRRAVARGARWIRGPRVVAPLREEGAVRGAILDDGTELRAPLTVDATSDGALLSGLPGTWLPGGRYPLSEREAVLQATIPVRPDRVQASWVGRAQLLLGLSRPGALAWRCTPHCGTPVYVSLTAGPGEGRSSVEALLQEVLDGSLPPDVPCSLRWWPCRRPLDVGGATGLLICGSAASGHDTLLGTHLAALERGALEMGGAIATGWGTRDAEAPAWFRAWRSFQRGAGAGMAVRHLHRRFLTPLSDEQFEQYVLSGVLAPGCWSRAAAGGPLLSAAGALSALAGRSSRHLALRALGWLARSTALRTHHARFPRRPDPFALVRWQLRTEELFRLDDDSRLR